MPIRTLEELEASDRLMLSCNDIYPLLGASPATIHQQAMERPDLLGFPVCVAQSRVKIPRLGLIKFLKGELPPCRYLYPTPWDSGGGYLTED